MEKGFKEVIMLKKPLIVQEGYPFILGAFLIALFVAWMGYYYIAVFPFVFSIYFAFFFRCPNRNSKIPVGEELSLIHI